MVTTRCAPRVLSLLTLLATASGVACSSGALSSLPDAAGDLAGVGAEIRDLATNDAEVPDLLEVELPDAEVDLLQPPRAWHYETTANIFHAVAGTGATNVYRGGGIAVDRSVDRGRTWKSVFSFPMDGSGPTSLWVEGNIVVGVGPGVKPVILRSVAGGAWSHPAQPNGLSTLFSVAGTGTRLYATGVANNAGCILLSGDAGQTWNMITSPGEFPLDHPLGVWVLPKTTISYVAGSNKFATGIASTSDGGKTWTDRSPIGTADLWAVWGSDAMDIFAVGSEGTILHARDGATFVRENSGVVLGLWAVWGSGPRNVYAVGYDNVVVRSTDRGNTWAQQTLPIPKGVSLDSYGIWGSSADDIYIVGEVKGGGGTGFVLHWY